MSKPYIGVTGFTKPSETAEIINSLPINPERKVMFGVLMSKKTLFGKPAGNPKRYPKREIIPQIFPNHRAALNLIHYNSDTDRELHKELFQVINNGGPFADGIQLNIPWPSLEELERFKSVYDKAIIVLQVGTKAFKMVNESPDELLEKIHSYRDVITHVLIDMSGGRGIALDKGLVFALLPYIQSMQILSVVAGGINENNFHTLVRPIAKHFPQTSFDIESGARDKNDNLDLEKSKKLINMGLGLGI